MTETIESMPTVQVDHRYFGSTPDKGADTVLWLATSPEAATVSGKLFAKRTELKTPGQGSDPAARQRLWEESEKLTVGSGPRM